MADTRTAVVLSAGGSTRMGSPKGLLQLDGTALLAAHCDRFQHVAERIIVVLGADARALRPVVPVGVEVVVNAAWRTDHPADSLHIALQDVFGPCWVAPVDTPPATSETLAALLRAGTPAVPCTAEGAPGHPVWLGPDLVAAIRVRAPDSGLRALLSHATQVEVADPEVATDFDDPGAWQRYLTRVTGRRQAG